MQQKECGMHANSVHEIAMFVHWEMVRNSFAYYHFRTNTNTHSHTFHSIHKSESHFFVFCLFNFKLNRWNPINGTSESHEIRAKMIILFRAFLFALLCFWSRDQSECPLIFYWFGFVLVTFFTQYFTFGRVLVDPLWMETTHWSMHMNHLHSIESWKNKSPLNDIISHKWWKME